MNKEQYWLGIRDFVKYLITHKLTESQDVIKCVQKHRFLEPSGLAYVIKYSECKEYYKIQNIAASPDDAYGIIENIAFWALFGDVINQLETEKYEQIEDLNFNQQGDK